MFSRQMMQDLLDRMAEAYRSGDADSCAAMFAPDAQLHSPFAEAAIGRTAIRELHKDWTAEPSSKSFILLDHGSTTEMAWGLCRFSEGNATGDGTSLFVLERGPTATWLIRSCCLFGDPD